MSVLSSSIVKNVAQSEQPSESSQIAGLGGPDRPLGPLQHPADTFPVDSVTPELALVDPALLASALAQLAAPSDCLARRTSPPIARSEAPRVTTVRPAIQTAGATSVGAPRQGAIAVRAAASREESSAHVPFVVLATLVGAFNFAYFLGGPLVELVTEALRGALPA